MSPDIPIPPSPQMPGGNIEAPPVPQSPDRVYISKKLTDLERAELKEKLRNLKGLADLDAIADLANRNALADLADLRGLDDLLDLDQLDLQVEDKKKLREALEKVKMNLSRGKGIEGMAFDLDFDFEEGELESIVESAFEGLEGNIEFRFENDGALSSLEAGLEAGLEDLGSFGEMEGSWNINLGDDDESNIEFYSCYKNSKHRKNCNHGNHNFTAHQNHESHQNHVTHHNQGSHHNHGSHHKNCCNNQDAGEIIAASLFADELIDMEKFRFKIQEDRMWIGRKKYSGKMFDKYKKLVEKIYDQELTKGTKIEIKLNK